ncbi:MAG: bifunctional phosphopantothenoylcysteine decarboxylase/phosphopantothenate--cysteine ligase CoaBC [Sulfolobales archaeon]
MYGYEHPSKDIIGKYARTLLDHSIALGVTASVSLYRSLDLARELMRRGAEVYPIISKSAAKLISPIMWEWATGNRAYVEFGGEIGHVEIARKVSGMVIAPATANTIAKIAHGIADTSVTLTAQIILGVGKRLLLVPAMHEPMYRSPALVRALEICREIGVSILPPVIEEGRAKYPDPVWVADKIEALVLRGEDLKKYKILVTAGPTREHLDPVRFISNPSTGKMGVAIASEAFYRGGETKLIHGPLSISVNPWISREEVISTEDMLKAVIKNIREFKPDAVILAAAPADFRFSKREDRKIPSDISKLSVELEATSKIAALVRREAKESIVVGFAAETVSSEEELIDKAHKKLEKYGFDMIMANYVGFPGTGFGYDTDAGVLLDSNGRVLAKGFMLKREWARIILDHVKEKVSKGSL